MTWQTRTNDLIRGDIEVGYSGYDLDELCN